MNVKDLKELLQQLENDGYSDFEVIIDHNSSPFIGYIIMEKDKKIELETAW